MGAVASALPPAEACQFLIDLANLRGGPDNITVVVVRVGAGKGKGKGGSPAKRSSGTPWYQRVPWPLWILLAGVLMAAVAAGLMYLGKQTNSALGGELAFVIAAITIFAGLGGLVWYYKQEQAKEATTEPEFKPRIKVYRESDCRINQELVDKLAKAELAMVQRGKERNWEVNWTKYQLHRELADKYMSQGDLQAGFREFCRGMRQLTEALQKTRHKEESFQPHWEKTED
jgi:protein phosphatase